MRSVLAVVCLFVCGVTLGVAQGPAGGGSTTGRTALTIYNQDFAVIRMPVELNLQAGTTDVSETHVTAQAEPDSVVLRDVTGKRPIHILEQNYDGALRVQAQMLAKFEGKTIDFVVGTADNTKIIPGRIISAGNVPQYDLLERYGQNYFYQMNQGAQQREPVIEMEGKLRYGLPGTPLFPAETPDLRSIQLCTGSSRRRRQHGFQLNWITLPAVCGGMRPTTSLPLRRIAPLASGWICPDG